MKRQRLVPAILLLACGQALAQDAAVQVYGRLHLGLEHVRIDGGAQDPVPSWRASNYRSVLGFRGSEHLGGGLRLLFQVEGALALDTGSGAPASRDTRIGLEGPWGTLFGGNWTTPYNASTSGLDPFYTTTAGYMSIMGNGAAPSADNLGDTGSFDRRQRNSLHYWTPAWHGLSLRLAHGFNEERPASGARPALDSAAVVLERGPLYAALAHERHRAYQGPGLNDQGSKLALAWQFGRTRLAGIAETLRYRTAAGPLQRTAYFLSLSHQAGPHGIRFGVAQARDGGGPAGAQVGAVRAGPDTGAVHATLGYDYALSKRTSLFAFHTRLRNDERAVYDFAINGLAPQAGSRLAGTVLGIRHAF